MLAMTRTVIEKRSISLLSSWLFRLFFSVFSFVLLQRFLIDSNSKLRDSCHSYIKKIQPYPKIKKPRMHEWISVQSSLLGLLYRSKYVMDIFTTNAISYCILDNPHLFIKNIP